MDMSRRRILSLWFPRLAAERVLRLSRTGMAGLSGPLAVVADRNGAQVIVSLSQAAEAAGVAVGQPLRDATAMCPRLATVPADPVAEAAFLTRLRRWVGKFSPWVAEEPPATVREGGLFRAELRRLTDQLTVLLTTGGDLPQIDPTQGYCAECSYAVRCQRWAERFGAGGGIVLPAIADIAEVPI